MCINHTQRAFRGRQKQVWEIEEIKYKMTINHPWSGSVQEVVSWGEDDQEKGDELAQNYTGRAC